MRLDPRSFLALATILASCRGEPASRTESSAAASSPAPAASASAAASEVRIFAATRVVLHDITVTVGRDRAPNELDVRAKIDVVPGGQGRVEIPTKIVCLHGDRQVAAFTKMINTTSDRFSLERHGKADAFARAPTNVGWMGKPEACEITFRLDPIGVANQSVRDAEEKVCWRGAITAGSCNFPPPPAPSAKLEVHDLSATLTPERIEIRGHLKTRDKDPMRTSITCEATCEEEQPTSEFLLLPSTDPLSFGAGESRAFSLEVGRAGERSAKRCTLALSARAWTDQVAEESIDLGKWCVGEAGVTAGACAP